MRLILLALLFVPSLFAYIFSPLHTTILSVDEEGETATIPTLENVQVGMYGAVSHRFDVSHATALYWLEVTKIDSDVTTVKFVPIKALEQSALPTGNWEPKVGDEVVMPYNYHRSILIAPNRIMYKRITEFHKERYWVHPDIFAAVLSTRGHPTPLVEDFQYACRMNNIGTVAFNFDKTVITVDCHSFKIIENRATNVENNDTQLPFYTRVSHIEANWFGDGSDELEAYTPHYVEILSEMNPDNQWIQDYKRELEGKDDDDSSWFSFGSDDEPDESNTEEE